MTKVKKNGNASATCLRKLKHPNPVAKNARKFNLAVVHLDRKKAMKRGKIKHKKNHQGE